MDFLLHFSLHSSFSACVSVFCFLVGWAFPLLFDRVLLLTLWHRMPACFRHFCHQSRTTISKIVAVHISRHVFWIVCTRTFNLFLSHCLDWTTRVRSNKWASNRKWKQLRNCRILGTLSTASPIFPRRFASISPQTYYKFHVIIGQLANIILYFSYHCSSNSLGKKRNSVQQQSLRKRLEFYAKIVCPTVFRSDLIPNDKLPENEKKIQRFQKVINHWASNQNFNFKSLY